MFGINNYYEPIINFSNFKFSQLADALLFGSSVLLIGMVTIFAVLCILWIFLILFRIVFHDMPKKKAEKKVITPVKDEQINNNINEIENGELIAVITAAIAMAESDGSGSNFRVVSFKRT